MPTESQPPSAVQSSSEKSKFEILLGSNVLAAVVTVILGYGFGTLLGGQWTDHLRRNERRQQEYRAMLDAESKTVTDAARLVAKTSNATNEYISPGLRVLLESKNEIDRSRGVAIVKDYEEMRRNWIVEKVALRAQFAFLGNDAMSLKWDELFSANDRLYSCAGRSYSTDKASTGCAPNLTEVNSKLGELIAVLQARRREAVKD